MNEPARQFRGVWLPVELLDDLWAGRLTAEAVALYAHLDAHNLPDAGELPHTRLLASALHLGPATARHALASLIALGHIKGENP